MALETDTTPISDFPTNRFTSTRSNPVDKIVAIFVRQFQLPEANRVFTAPLSKYFFETVRFGRYFFV